MTFNLKWHDGQETEFTALPVKVQEIFGSYGFQTMLRFASAKANTDARKAIVNGSKRKVSEVKTDEVKAWREANADRYDALATEYMNAFRTDAIAGNIEMPGVSGESLSQDEIDRRAAAVKTIDDAFAAMGKKYPWPRAERGSGEEGALAAALAREADILKFLSMCVEGGRYAGQLRAFNRNLAAIKKDRIRKAQPEATGGLDELGALAQAAQ
jgi:hypothetical protein